MTLKDKLEELRSECIATAPAISLTFHINHVLPTKQILTMSILSFFTHKPKSTTITMHTEVDNTHVHTLNPTLDPIAQEIKRLSQDPIWIRALNEMHDKEKNKASKANKRKVPRGTKTKGEGGSII